MLSPLLRVQGLSKRFGTRPVLESVSFEVRPGEVLGLIGPNGAGKTTLFQCLAGLLPADTGTVHGDRALRPEDRKSILYYVPDGIHPWPDQTLGWIVMFYERL